MTGKGATELDAILNFFIFSSFLSLSFVSIGLNWWLGKQWADYYRDTEQLLEHHQFSFMLFSDVNFRFIPIYELWSHAIPYTYRDETKDERHTYEII